VSFGGAYIPVGAIKRELDKIPTSRRKSYPKELTMGFATT